MRIWLSAAVFSLPMLAMAQSACSSDGQAAPTGLMERFISADCADCWASAPIAPPWPANPGAGLDRARQPGGGRPTVCRWRGATASTACRP
jgi:hypothetical protein